MQIKKHRERKYSPKYEVVLADPGTAGLLGVGGWARGCLGGSTAGSEVNKQKVIKTQNRWG